MIPDMTGKVCIVTGSNTGIGKTCALELAKHGAHVIVASRTPSKGLAAVEEIRSETGNDNVEYLQLDLMSLASVTRFIEAYKAKNLPIHLLINNAGIMANPYTLSDDGIESQFATNHANSLNDESKYSPFFAYGRSKAANILFTRELTQRLEAQGIRNIYVNTNHPGFVDSELQRYTSPFIQMMLKKLILVSTSEGAITQLYLGTSPEVEQNNIKGKYYIPFGAEKAPQQESTSQENQTLLWDFSEALLKEKVPNYLGAGI
ncbi:unnamed protein product [Umbelopsis vinacea]